MANRYASLEDYEARYGVQGEAASERIETLLDDAALYLDVAVDKYQIDVEEQAAALTVVCCSRAHYIEERGDGTSSRTQQAGPYSITTSYQSKLKGFESWFIEQFGDLFDIAGGVACVAIGYGDDQ